MARKESHNMYAKEPILQVDEGKVRLRGHELTIWTLRFFLAQGIASLASLWLRAAYAVNPEEHSATYRVYEPRR